MRSYAGAESRRDNEIWWTDSPISGETLSRLIALAGGTGSFSAAYFTYQHGGIEPVLVGLFAIGGAKIVIGASDGIAEAFRMGFKYHLLRLMGVPQEAAAKKVARRKRTKEPEQAKEAEPDPAGPSTYNA